MTKKNNNIYKSLLAVLSIGTTLVGWSLLAKKKMDANNLSMEVTSTTDIADAESLNQSLPPVPTVAALVDYAGVEGGEIELDLEPIPVVIDPGPRQTIYQQAPGSSSPQSNQPVTSSGSSS